MAVAGYRRLGVPYGNPAELVRRRQDVMPLGDQPLHEESECQREATARIKINKLLEAAGWDVFPMWLDTGRTMMAARHLGSPSAR